MIAIVEYGLGNIQAFANVFRRIGLPVTCARTPDDLRKARKIILPGVGAFDWSMRRLDESGLRGVLDDMVLGAKADVLGVCVGMQMMARRSEEGQLPGLGWIDAEVVRFDTARFDQQTHLPHMGWNAAHAAAGSALFREMPCSSFYFLHSYHVVTAQEESVLAKSFYGVSFTSALRSGNIYGTQFHPEKSHGAGVALLRNFVEI